MTKAKTASKNDPSSRQAMQAVFFNSVEVVPVKFVGNGRVYMAIADKGGNLVYGPSDNENPLPWAATKA
jgi:hypothetical protein